MTSLVMRRCAPALALLVLLTLAGPANARARCPVAGASCLLPWPSDAYTVRDRSTATGRRLALRRRDMPRNAHGVPIDPRPYDASDGFSPGQTIVVQVPGLDSRAAFARNGLVPQTDLARTYAPRQRVLVLDAATGRRHLIWAELDAQAKRDRDRALLIHPAVDWTEGHRYVVVLRDLSGPRGRAPGVPARLRGVLGRARITGRIYRAWDFTVASAMNIARRELSIRDRAFAGLGDRNLKDLKVAGRPPGYTVDRVERYTPAEQPHVARRVFGHVAVPCYLDRRGCPPGARFRLGRGGLPVRLAGNTYQARFICNVPRSASPDRPARPSLYGHGLFGTAQEVEADNVEQFGDENDVMVCAADWIGMADEDVPNGVALLGDLSKFPSLADRLQQGYLDFMFLGRLMIHRRGFAAAPAFSDAGRPVIDTRRLFYYGNSQGGIAGGGLTAVAPDFTRSVLYVGAMNYSLLLQRSVDFDDFALVLNPAYPNDSERQLVLSMIQILWDRGEPNGYAQHMVRDPYPNTPRHDVLQLLSFGDHQVANVATEVEARTIGSRLRVPATDPGRHSDRRPYFGIPRLGRGPFSGPAALVVWDIGPTRPAGTCPEPADDGTCGTPTPPAANLPPRPGVDPHDLVIDSEARVRRQIGEWLKLRGRLIDPCGRAPCHAAGWTGPLR